ncbi:hypothetical protein AA0X95_00990 [Bacillus sp. 1P10SD]|uniref:hypothetical protein n=1 Tax=Bacillus sp. 1P10SD TaxID=3132265 RepID=UPI0039A5172A
MNARQYFYSIIKKENKGKSYQKIYQEKIYNGNNTLIGKKILRHIPKWSNDRLLEELVVKLINNNSDYIRKRLENVFIAKIRDFKSNAYAVQSMVEYWGDLVYFHVGLSDACFQFTTVYTEFLQARGKIKIDEHSDKMAYVNVLIHVHKLLEAIKDWTIQNEDIVGLKENTIIIPESNKIEQKAASIAVLTDLFILSHEVSHHLLGHTGKRNDGLTVLNLLPKDCRYWENKNLNHSNEYQADALALMLMLGISASNFTQSQLAKGESRKEIETVLGSLLTLSILKLMSKDSNKPSETHPSIDSRIEQCKKILSLFVTDTLLNSFDSEISDFCTLFETIKKGN